MTVARRVDLSQRAAKLNEAEKEGAQLQDTVLRGSEGRFLRRVSLQPLPLLAADTIADRLRLHLPTLDTSKETVDDRRRWLLLHALGTTNNVPQRRTTDSSGEEAKSKLDLDSLRSNAASLDLSDLLAKTLLGREKDRVYATVDTELAWRLGTFEDTDAGVRGSVRDITDTFSINADEEARSGTPPALLSLYTHARTNGPVVVVHCISFAATSVLVVVSVYCSRLCHMPLHCSMHM